jgi:hypothetical protein
MGDCFAIRQSSAALAQSATRAFTRNGAWAAAPSAAMMKIRFKLLFKNFGERRLNPRFCRIL